MNARLYWITQAKSHALKIQLVQITLRVHIILQTYRVERISVQPPDTDPLNVDRKSKFLNVHCKLFFIFLNTWFIDVVMPSWP